MTKPRRTRRKRQQGGILTMPNSSRPRMHRSTGPNLSNYVQRGGVFALAALIPALVAASKAAALVAVGGAAGYGVKKGLEAATRKKNKRR